MSEKKSIEPRNVRTLGTKRVQGTQKFNDVDRILQAARACFERFGVARTRLEDVAKETGISRPLLYQFFGTRQALMDAAINKELEYLVAQQALRMKEFSNFSEALIEGAIAGIELARRDVVLTDLIVQSSTKHLPSLLLDPDQVAHHIVLALWQPFFEKARKSGELRADLSDHDIMEWLMSVQYMFLLRDEISTERMQELLALFLAPALSAGETKPKPRAKK